MMLTVTGSPQWFTVVGGSRTYVERIAAQLPGARVGSPLTAVWRHADAVEVEDASGVTARFDRVVVATHADQALSLLADPTDDEVAVLKSFGYTPNETVLHTDASLLPRATQARASWNYLMDSCSTLGSAPVVRPTPLVRSAKSVPSPRFVPVPDGVPGRFERMTSALS